MAKIGRPTRYDREFHNDDFLVQSKKGKNIKQIAANWDIERSILYQWANKHIEFKHTMKKGQDLCEAWYMDIGQSAIIGAVKIDGKPIKVDLGFFVWMTKNVCKWSDKIESKNKNTETLPKVTLTLPDNGSSAIKTKDEDDEKS